METRAQMHWLRGSAPYINAHRLGTFVLMLGGDALEHPNFENIVHDMALLKSLDVRIVLVFGARPQIDAALAAAGLEARYHAHRRITDTAAMAVVRQVVGELRIRIESLLSTSLPGTPMHASRITATGGNWAVAKPLGVVDGVDFEQTGEVRRVEAAALTRQLDADAIPVLGPLGYSPSGETFNLAYEELAGATAAALKADKLITLDAARGLLDSEGALIPEMTPGRLDVFLDALDDASAPGSERWRELAAVLTAARAGVRRCHIVSYAEDGALLAELFTREGSGTQITEHSAEQLRPATLDDVTGIREITEPLEARGVLMARSREQIEREINTFTVMRLDGMVIACAALHALDADAGELACLATHPDYQGGDRGERLVARIVDDARRNHFTRLFVLTTRAAHWFVEQGFEPISLEQLPSSRRASWCAERGSRVLMKALADSD